MNKMKKYCQTKIRLKHQFIDYGIYNPAIGSHQLGPKHLNADL
jgi:hypothetical protein